MGLCMASVRHLMDDAHFKVINGTTDYNTAVRQACAALAESGLRTIYYKSGHSDRIEVAVRRAVMTSVSQVTQAIAEENAEELGADGWEISAHFGARPSHAEAQGKQYEKALYETKVKPIITDYNCRHSAFPIIMKVSEPVYTEEELEEMKNPIYYEQQQQMRKMERAMRKQKDLCITADARGKDGKNDFIAASIKLRRMKDIYEEFCKKMAIIPSMSGRLYRGITGTLLARQGLLRESRERRRMHKLPTEINFQNLKLKKAFLLYKFTMKI